MPRGSRERSLGEDLLSPLNRAEPSGASSEPSRNYLKKPPASAPKGMDRRVVLVLMQTQRMQSPEIESRPGGLHRASANRKEAKTHRKRAPAKIRSQAAKEESSTLMLWEQAIPHSLQSPMWFPSFRVRVKASFWGFGLKFMLGDQGLGF